MQTHPCPDTDATTAALHLSLPRGRAWRTTPGEALDGSVLGRFWRAVAGPMAATSRRLCTLIDEFFCATAVETLDAWALDYGLPDPCDPFLDVCSKVAAVGDTTTDYAIAVALSRGWSITIGEEFILGPEDGSYASGLYGAQLFGAMQGVAWRVTVDLSGSLAYQAVAGRPPLFGAMLFGDSWACGPDIEALRCLIRRIAPAQCDLVFETVSPPVIAGGPSLAFDDADNSQYLAL